jgi:prolyl-tRNA synthetase
MGALVEAGHDEQGIVWPEIVAPYQVHLIQLEGMKKKAEKIYSLLSKRKIEVLWDDRQPASAGVKFADADLIGIPIRLVVSEKTGDKIEWKKRNSSKIELLTIEQIVNRLA